MNNNIFIKMKKDKFNPDIEPKLKSKETERDNVTFELHNSIYNPITGVIPNKINSINDLVLEKDKSLDKVNIQKLISEKSKERINQDNIHKPVKTKIINNSPIQQTNKVNEPNKSYNVNRTNYIETFEDMKMSLNKKSEQTKIQPQPKNNYDNILDGLKDLGIIK